MGDYQYLGFMPSHASHLLFALECLELRAELLEPALLRSINHGAQLPDMFYHNRRTRPSGLYVSVALHRRGFATMAADLLAKAENQTQYLSALAFLSHGVLDRRLHPWINAFTGWYDPAVPHSIVCRYQHPLCERLIDVYLARTLEQEWTLGKAFSDCWGPYPVSGERLDFEQAGGSRFMASLCTLYPRCAADPDLPTRLQNAWIDSRGYYHWTSNLNPKEYRSQVADAIRMWQETNHGQQLLDDESALRFASLVHPRLAGNKEQVLPPALLARFTDQTNPWRDPCHDDQSFQYDLGELWKIAGQEMSQLIERVKPYAGDVAAADQIQKTLAAAGFHNGDLRSWQGEKGNCRLDSCQIVDWFGLWFDQEAASNHL